MSKKDSRGSLNRKPKFAIRVLNAEKKRVWRDTRTGKEYSTKREYFEATRE